MLTLHTEHVSNLRYYTLVKNLLQSSWRTWYICIFRGHTSAINTELVNCAFGMRYLKLHCILQQHI